MTFYQDYVITIYRTPTLTDKTGLSLTAEGADVPIAYKTASGEATGFDRSVTEYSATIPRSAESVTVTLKPLGKELRAVCKRRSGTPCPWTAKRAYRRTRCR